MRACSDVCRNLTDAGPLQLIDDESADEDDAELLPVSFVMIEGLATLATLDKAINEAGGERTVEGLLSVSVPCHTHIDASTIGVLY